MAGEGGSRTHLSTCMDKPVLKTGRATGPYPPPSLTMLGVYKLDLFRLLCAVDVTFGYYHLGL